MSKKLQQLSKHRQVPALKRAFAILDGLDQTSFGLTVQEVRRQHKIPYSTAFYLLETMCEFGYVQRDAESKKYRLGHKILSFREGKAASHLLDLRATARPLMEELTELTCLTTHLSILGKDEAVYIEKVEPTGYIRLNTWIGKRNALHCTASGKALLMLLSEPDIRKICPAKSLVRRTARTIISLTSFLEDLKRSAERGYTIDDAEDEEQGRCVAAAIIDKDSIPCASLSIAGTLGQLDISRIDALGKLVKNYAEQVSARIGYRSVLRTDRELEGGGQ